MSVAQDGDGFMWFGAQGGLDPARRPPGPAVGGHQHRRPGLVRQAARTLRAGGGRPAGQSRRICDGQRCRRRPVGGHRRRARLPRRCRRRAPLPALGGCAGGPPPRPDPRPAARPPGHAVDRFRRRPGPARRRQRPGRGHRRHRRRRAVAERQPAGRRGVRHPPQRRGPGGRRRRARAPAGAGGPGPAAGHGAVADRDRAGPVVGRYLRRRHPRVRRVWRQPPQHHAPARRGRQPGQRPGGGAVARPQQRPPVGGAGRPGHRPDRAGRHAPRGPASRSAAAGHRAACQPDFVHDRGRAERRLDRHPGRAVPHQRPGHARAAGAAAAARGAAAHRQHRAARRRAMAGYAQRAAALRSARRHRQGLPPGAGVGRRTHRQPRDGPARRSRRRAVGGHPQRPQSLRSGQRPRRANPAGTGAQRRLAAGAGQRAGFRPPGTVVGGHQWRRHCRAHRQHGRRRAAVSPARRGRRPAQQAGQHLAARPGRAHVDVHRQRPGRDRSRHAARASVRPAGRAGVPVVLQRRGRPDRPRRAGVRHVGRLRGGAPDAGAALDVPAAAGRQRRTARQAQRAGRAGAGGRRAGAGDSRRHPQREYRSGVARLFRQRAQPLRFPAGRLRQGLGGGRRQPPQRHLCQRGARHVHAAPARQQPRRRLESARADRGAAFPAGLVPDLVGALGRGAGRAAAGLGPVPAPHPPARARQGGAAAAGVCAHAPPGAGARHRQVHQRTARIRRAAAGDPARVERHRPGQRRLRADLRAGRGTADSARQLADQRGAAVQRHAAHRGAGAAGRCGRGGHARDVPEPRRRRAGRAHLHRSAGAGLPGVRAGAGVCRGRPGDVQGAQGTVYFRVPESPRDPRHPAGARRRRGLHPRQERFFGQHQPRDPHPDERHPGLCRPGCAPRSAGQAARVFPQDRPRRQEPAGHHRRRARFFQDRIGQAGAGKRGVRPGRRAGPGGRPVLVARGGKRPGTGGVGRSRRARAPVRRSAAAGPGVDQPGGQRPQVHRARPYRAARDAGHRRRAACRSGRSGRTWRGRAALCRVRYRRGHQRRAAAAPVPRVQPGRQQHHPAVRWHRAGPGDLAAAGARHGRGDRRGQHARQRQLLPVRRSAAQLAGRARSSAGLRRPAGAGGRRQRGGAHHARTAVAQRRPDGGRGRLGRRGRAGRAGRRPGGPGIAGLGHAARARRGQCAAPAPGGGAGAGAGGGHGERVRPRDGHARGQPAGHRRLPVQARQSRPPAGRRGAGAGTGDGGTGVAAHPARHAMAGRAAHRRRPRAGGGRQRDQPASGARSAAGRRRARRAGQQRHGCRAHGGRRPFRRRADGYPDAGNGWLRGHRADPCAPSGHAVAGDRHDRARGGGLPRKQPGHGHERLRHQADRTGAAVCRAGQLDRSAGGRPAPGRAGARHRDRAVLAACRRTHPGARIVLAACRRTHPGARHRYGRCAGAAGRQPPAAHGPARQVRGRVCGYAATVARCSRRRPGRARRAAGAQGQGRCRQPVHGPAAWCGRCAGTRAALGARGTRRLPGRVYRRVRDCPGRRPGGRRWRPLGQPPRNLTPRKHDEQTQLRAAQHHAGQTGHRRWLPRPHAGRSGPRIGRPGHRTRCRQRTGRTQPAIARSGRGRACGAGKHPRGPRRHGAVPAVGRDRGQPGRLRSIPAVSATAGLTASASFPPARSAERSAARPAPPAPPALTEAGFSIPQFHHVPPRPPADKTSATGGPRRATAHGTPSGGCGTSRTSAPPAPPSPPAWLRRTASAGRPPSPAPARPFPRAWRCAAGSAYCRADGSGTGPASRRRCAAPARTLPPGAGRRPTGWFFSARWRADPRRAVPGRRTCAAAGAPPPPAAGWRPGRSCGPCSGAAALRRAGRQGRAAAGTRPRQAPPAAPPAAARRSGPAARRSWGRPCRYRCARPASASTCAPAPPAAPSDGCAKSRRGRARRPAPPYRLRSRPARPAASRRATTGAPWRRSASVRALHRFWLTLPSTARSAASTSISRSRCGASASQRVLAASALLPANRDAQSTSSSSRGWMYNTAQRRIFMKPSLKLEVKKSAMTSGSLAHCATAAKARPPFAGAARRHHRHPQGKLRIVQHAPAVFAHGTGQRRHGPARQDHRSPPQGRARQYAVPHWRHVPEPVRDPPRPLQDVPGQPRWRRTDHRLPDGRRTAGHGRHQHRPAPLHGRGAGRQRRNHARAKRHAVIGKYAGDPAVCRLPGQPVVAVRGARVLAQYVPAAHVARGNRQLPGLDHREHQPPAVQVQERGSGAGQQPRNRVARSEKTQGDYGRDRNLRLTPPGPVVCVAQACACGITPASVARCAVSATPMRRPGASRVVRLPPAPPSGCARAWAGRLRMRPAHRAAPSARCPCPAGSHATAAAPGARACRQPRCAAGAPPARRARHRRPASRTAPGGPPRGRGAARHDEDRVFLDVQGRVVHCNQCHRDLVRTGVRGTVRGAQADRYGARFGRCQAHGVGRDQGQRGDAGHADAVRVRRFGGVHDLQPIDVFDHAVFHLAAHGAAVADHVQLERHAQGQGRAGAGHDQAQYGRVDAHARAPGAAPHGAGAELLGQRALGAVADQAARCGNLVHHAVAGVHAGGAADALVLQAVADVDAGGADLHAQRTVDAGAARIDRTFCKGATGLAAGAVVGDDQGVAVEHRALEAGVRAHVFAHLFAHPARVAVRGKRVEQHPEPFPGSEIKRLHFHHQFADGREIADKGKTGPQGDGAPRQVLGGFPGEFLRRPRLAVEQHARAAPAFDAALDPQEDFGVHRLRTGKTAPHAPGHGGGQEQQIGADNQQHRQVDKILRPQDHAEDVELTRGQVEQQGLATVPLQPRGAVKGQLREPHEQPAQPRVTARGFARAPDVRGQHVHLGVAQEIAERGHGGRAAVADGFHDGVRAAAEQPDLVRQVRCTDGLVAPGVGAVARHARAEFRLAEHGLDGIGRGSGQAQHVVGDVFDVLVAAQGRAHRRHGARAAVQDGLLDGVRRAAEQPVLVGQVRKALVAARIGPMALGAVGEEQPLADGARLRIGRHGFQILFLVPGEQRTVVGLGLFQLGLVVAGGAPAQPARVTAQARVQHQVCQREDDGDVEQPHPPARHRRVQLGQILVPHMTGGVDIDVAALTHPGLRLRPQQDGAADDAQQGDGGDVIVPEAAGKVSHDAPRPFPPAVPRLADRRSGRLLRSCPSVLPARRQSRRPCTGRPGAAARAAWAPRPAAPTWSWPATGSWAYSIPAPRRADWRDGCGAIRRCSGRPRAPGRARCAWSPTGTAGRRRTRRRPNNGRSVRSRRAADAPSASGSCSSLRARRCRGPSAVAGWLPGRSAARGFFRSIHGRISWGAPISVGGCQGRDGGGDGGAAAQRHPGVVAHHAHAGEVQEAAHHAHHVVRISRFHAFDKGVGQGAVRVDRAPHQALHHAGDPHGRDVQHHADGGHPEVQIDQLDAVHFLLAHQARNQVVDRAHGDEAHPAQRAAVHVRHGPVGVVGQGVDGLDRHHRPFEGGDAVKRQRDDHEFQDRVGAQLVPSAGQGHHAVDHAAPRRRQQHQREHHAHRLRPVRQRRVVQMVRAGPHIGEDQRPEVHDRQAIGIDGTLGLFRDEVIDHAQVAGGEDEAHRVMAVPPLDHGVLHARVGRVRLGEAGRHHGALHHVQDGHGQDVGAEEPVGHVDVLDLAGEQGAEEHDGVRDPHHRDQDRDRPFELRVFLAARKTHGQRDHGQQDHGLPAPEGEGSQRVGKQPHLAGALHHVVRRGKQAADAERKDHGIGVQRPQAAVGQPGDVQVQRRPCQAPRADSATGRYPRRRLARSESGAQAEAEAATHDIVIDAVGWQRRRPVKDIVDGGEHFGRALGAELVTAAPVNISHRWHDVVVDAVGQRGRVAGVVGADQGVVVVAAADVTQLAGRRQRSQLVGGAGVPRPCRDAARDAGLAGAVHAVGRGRGDVARRPQLEHPGALHRDVYGAAQCVAEVAQRLGIRQLQVEAVRAQLAHVGVHAGHGCNRVIGGKRDGLAVAGFAIAQAVVDQGLERHRGDCAVNVDSVVVGRHAQAFQRRRLEHDAHRGGGRLFRCQRRVATGVGRHHVTGIERGARVEQRLRGRVARAEQLGQVRRPDVARAGAAQADVGRGRIRRARLPGGDVARGRITGAARGAVDIDRMDAGQSRGGGYQRHQRFQVHLFYVQLAIDRLHIVDVEGAGRGQRVRRRRQLFLAVLEAAGKRDGTGPAGKRCALQIGRRFFQLRHLLEARLAQDVGGRRSRRRRAAQQVDRHAAIGGCAQGRAAGHRAERQAGRAHVGSGHRHSVDGAQHIGADYDIGRGLCKIAARSLQVDVPFPAVAHCALQTRGQARRPVQVIELRRPERVARVTDAQRGRPHLRGDLGGQVGVVARDGDGRIEIDLGGAAPLAARIRRLHVKRDGGREVVRQPAQERGALDWRAQRERAIDAVAGHAAAEHGGAGGVLAVRKRRRAHGAVRAGDELLAAQRGRVGGHVLDQAAGGHVTDADRAGNQVGGHARRARTRHGKGGHFLAAPVALVIIAHAAVVVVFAARNDAATALGKRGAARHADSLVARIALARLAVLDRALHAVDALFQTEVDHAGHGVRPVRGRGAARDHVHGLDQRRGDHVQVHAGRAGDVAVVGERQAVAAQQHQGAVRAQAAQVGKADAGAGGAAGGRNGGAECRDFIEHVAHVDCRALGNGGAADHGGGRRRLEAGAVDARGAHHHALRGIDGRRRRWRCERSWRRHDISRRGRCRRGPGRRGGSGSRSRRSGGSNGGPGRGACGGLRVTFAAARQQQQARCQPQRACQRPGPCRGPVRGALTNRRLAFYRYAHEFLRWCGIWNLVPVW
uniref:Uncharacterized protein n=1 Tax=Tanacetum cinerariifolium TaxID=118510 RepID=A0A699GFK1_TANCI|nr:hypothetical protein [Tanacetum cinerariifolium]